jgi:hypothetical protein
MRRVRAFTQAIDPAGLQVPYLPEIQLAAAALPLHFPHFCFLTIRHFAG